MSDPLPYQVAYSFGSFQANSPATPLPGPALDNELSDIATSNASLVAAMKDIRRSDGALKNGLVTFDSLALALQLMLNPTDATLVANAVAMAQAAQAAASGSATAATASATSAANSAAAAATSASGVNLSLFLPKAGNLAGIGNPDTARANISAAKVDGSDMVGRLGPTTGGGTVTDWNNAVTNGWFTGGGGATINGPDMPNVWITQVFAVNANAISQIAYNIGAANQGTSAVTVYRRHSWDNAGARTWTPWESATPVPVGTTIWVNGMTAPPGFLKENGALISRAQFPALTAFALASGNIVSEASWFAGNSGAFSTGDLATTIRLPDTRGEFIRAFDNGRGVDLGRGIGTNQADSLKDHIHTYAAPNAGGQAGNAPGLIGLSPSAPTVSLSTSSPSTGAASETRPRNIAKLACIKY